MAMPVPIRARSPGANVKGASIAAARSIPAASELM